MDKVKKFVCCGDYVISKTDGQRHYISASKLVKLYRLDPGECILSDHYARTWVSYNVDSTVEKLIFLYPDYYGNYKIEV